MIINDRAPILNSRVSSQLRWTMHYHGISHCLLLTEVMFLYPILTFLGFLFVHRRYWTFLVAAVMRSDGFEYLKENCPALLSELLRAVAGCEDDCSSGGGKSRSVWAQLSDGGDTNGRRVRQRT